MFGFSGYGTDEDRLAMEDQARACTYPVERGPADMSIGDADTYDLYWIKRTGPSRWIVGPVAGGQPAGGVSLARSPERARHYIDQITR